MKTFQNIATDSLGQYIDHKVVDRDGYSVGTLHSLWSDAETGAVEFLGVKAGWIFGRNYVVPAETARLDEAEHLVWLPYTEAFIKDGPAIGVEVDIYEAEEESINRYYSANHTDDAPGNGGSGVHDLLVSNHVPGAVGAGTPASASELGLRRTRSGTTPRDESRLRRTSRLDPDRENARATGTVSNSGIDEIGPTDADPGTDPADPAPETFATANMFGSTGTRTAPVAADSAGEPMLDPMEDVCDPLTNRSDGNVTNPDHGTAKVAPEKRHVR